MTKALWEVTGACRNPFQGGVGFSTGEACLKDGKQGFGRNPFQGGVGFSTPQGIEYRLVVSRRNPFQGGVGFSTRVYGIGWS